MLRQIIKASGESQKVWAERLGISPSHLSNIIQGHKVPTLALAARIERATNGKITASSWIPAEPAESGVVS